MSGKQNEGDLVRGMLKLIGDRLRQAALIGVSQKMPTTVDELNSRLDELREKEAAMESRALAAETSQEKLEVLQERLGRVDHYPETPDMLRKLVAERCIGPATRAGGRARGGLCRAVHMESAYGSGPRIRQPTVRPNVCPGHRAGCRHARHASEPARRSVARAVNPLADSDFRKCRVRLRIP
jgi:hypothetical protein